MFATSTIDLHSPAMSQQARLEKLLGSALIDRGVRERLLEQRDPQLLKEFGISDEVGGWLLATQASTLSDLARMINGSGSARF